jgi:hypothetical protein
MDASNYPVAASATKRIAYEHRGVTIVPLEDGRQGTIGPGLIIGWLTWESFVDPIRCSRDMGYSEVALKIRSAAAEPYEYRGLLHASALWCARDAVATRRNNNFRPDVSIHTLLDSRDEFLIEVDDGIPVSGRFKYTDCRFGLQLSELVLNVQATVHVYDLKATGQSGYDVIYYSIPYQSVLWRRAPVFYDDDFSPESSEFVDLVSIADALGDLPVSSVVVSPC